MMRIKEKRNLLFLFGETGISQIGSAIFTLTLSWWITSVTGNSSSYGTVMAFGLMPMLIMNIFGGAIADLISKKKILITTDLLSGIVSIGLGVYAFQHFNVLAITLFVVLLNVNLSFASPATRSILRELVTSQHVSKANSILSAMSETSKIVGPMIGGILLIKLPPGWMFIINGFSFWLAAIFNSFLVIQNNEIRYEDSSSSVLNKIKEGFSFILHQKYLLKVITLATLFNFFVAGISVLQPLVIHQLGSNSEMFALTNSVEAVGAVLGALIAVKWLKPIPLEYYLIAVGGAFVFSTIFGIWSIVTAFFAYGILVALFNIQFFSGIQKDVKTSYQGRVFSIIYTLASAAMPIGSYFWGVLGNHILDTGFSIIGGCIVIVSLSFLGISRSKLWKQF